MAYFHTGFAFPYLHPFGSFGVDIFFVISGFIMARVLETNSDYFFRRRLLRIVPPYWLLTILLFFAALAAPGLMGSTRAHGVQLLKSLLFIPFVKDSGIMQPILFVGWSLNYEMFFYVALAIALLLSKRYAIWIGATLVVATVLACARFAEYNHLAAFYSNDISIEFVLGILAYYICRAVPDAMARRLRAPALVICFASALFFVVVQGVFGRPGLSHLHWFGSTSFILIISATILSRGGLDINNRLVVLMGDASYILYLVHPYCEYLPDRALGSRFLWLKTTTASGAFIAVTVSIVVAIFLHVYCERPTMRFLNRNFGGKRKSIEFSQAPAA